MAYDTHKVDIDPAPLFQGLPGDRCQCPHWGVVTGIWDGPAIARHAAEAPMVWR